MDLPKIKQKILIVDDKPGNLTVLEAILDREDYEVFTAENGLAALDISVEQSPDLILLDIMMPSLDGFETCRLLKENPETQDVPVIFLTSRTEQEYIVKAFELGAVDYVIQPFESPELVRRLSTHLRNHLLHTELERQFEENNRLKREQEKFVRHELKNMLMPIQGYAEILSLWEGLDQKHKKFADSIFQGTQKILVLLDDLKKLQELETGVVEVDKTQVNLSAVLRRQIDQINVRFANRATITVQNMPQSVKIEADEKMISDMFYNLIENAVEHVCDLKEASDREITIQISEGAKDLTVSIHNKGPNIPQEILATFFEKFNAQNKQHGAGLGTTYAYWVTRVHGGDIAVSSNEEDGTIVTVKLPKA